VRFRLPRVNPKRLAEGRRENYLAGITETLHHIGALRSDRPRCGGEPLDRIESNVSSIADLSVTIESYLEEVP
jgi:hypothetical protein